jgi:hypothetical protein
MARTKISEFSATPGDNTDIDGIDIAEGCAPSGINNAIRELMAQLKDMQTGSSGDTFTLTTVNSTTVDTTNLEATNLKAKDGTAAGSIANSTGVVTLGSSVLTTTDINGGTVDGTAIGSSSASTGEFTTLSASGVATFSAGTVSAPAITTTGDTNTGIFFPAADTIAFAEGGAEAMRIDSSGNVGIGTSSPSSFGKFVVNSGTNKNIVSRSNVRLSGSTIQSIQDNAVTDSPLEIYTGSAQLQLEGTPLTFLTSGTERMSIDSNGNLLVGRGSVGSGDRFAVQTVSSGTIMLGYNSSAGLTYVIYENGDVRNSNNSYGAISDAKLKENVTDAKPQLQKINQVRVVNFNLIGDTRKQIGVVAQELEQVFPSLVEETPDRDSEGNNLDTTTKSVKYSVFVPILIKAIQEQQALIQDLTTRLAALEGN